MCIFCKIVNGEIPCFKVYEDDDLLAFLDISASTEGHTLIIPKKHYANIFDLDSEIAKKIMEKAVSISLQIKNKLNINSVNLVNNSGELAGQTIMHFHLHIIPRYPNDGMKITPIQREVNFEQLKITHQKLTN